MCNKQFSFPDGPRTVTHNPLFFIEKRGDNKPESIMTFKNLMVIKKSICENGHKREGDSIVTDRQTDRHLGWVSLSVFSYTEQSSLRTHISE